MEPFYVTLALYDATEGVKISEDFNIDLTNPEIKPTSSEESSNSDINRLVKETNKVKYMAILCCICHNLLGNIFC